MALLSASSAVGQGPTAARVLERMREIDSDVPLPTGPAAAFVRHAAGDISGAIEDVASVPSRRARALRGWLEDERSVLTGERMDHLAVRSADATPNRSRGQARRVVHVVTNSLPEVQAGYTVRTQGIARAQADRGLDVVVATPPGYPVAQGHLSARPIVSVDGIEHVRLRTIGGQPRTPGEHLDAHARSLESLVHRLRPQVLHAHSRHLNGQAALLAGHRSGVPVLYEVRGFIEETWRTRGGSPESDYYQWSRQAETKVMQRADAVVALSESMRGEIVGRGVDASRVSVVGNCVSAAYLSDSHDGLAIRRRHDLDGRIVVGSVTTLNDYEGIDVVIEAAAALDDDRLAVLIVGDGPARVSLQRRVAELRKGGCRTSIVLTGRVPRAEARDHHAAIDIFCVPRRRTPVTLLVPPLKPVEAMALGRVVVASDLPPLRELLQPDRGRLVPPDDVQALADAVAELARDANGRRELGDNARSYVATERTWSAAAANYETIYDCLTPS